MRLEIGGGTNPRAGYVNLDPNHADDLAFRVRLGYDKIPLPDASVEHAYASHVLEHIPAGQPRLDAMNEVWRVLVPGGQFEIIVPVIGYTDHGNGGGPVHAGWQGWADPTHVSQWWYPESFWYFCRPDFQACADYGKAMWAEGPMELRDGWEAHVVLVKP